MFPPLKTVSAACLAIGLVSTWDSPAASAVDHQFEGTITPTKPLADVYFIFSVGPCVPGRYEKIADSLPANVPTHFSVTVHNISDGYYHPGDDNNFSIVALYDLLNGGVTVGYNNYCATNVLASSDSTAWSGTYMPGYNFAGLYSQYVGATEADVAASLQNNTFASDLVVPYSLLSPTLNTNNGDFTLLNFSNASIGGTGTIAEVVPEPASASLLALATLPLVIRRRKQP